jgi:hypothetical protein
MVAGGRRPRERNEGVLLATNPIAGIYVRASGVASVVCRPCVHAAE